MFNINEVAAQSYFAAKPNTFKAMQYFVMALDDCAKNVGKKSFFGKDKGEKALESLGVNTLRTLRAMQADGVVSQAASWKDLHTSLREELFAFTEGFPTWVNAMAYGIVFFGGPMSAEMIKLYVEKYRTDKTNNLAA